MKRLLIFTFSLMLAFAMEVGADAANYADEQPSPQSTSEAADYNRHAISLELLGRGLPYSFNYDHLVHDDVAISAGLSTYSFT